MEDSGSQKTRKDDEAAYYELDSKRYFKPFPSFDVEGDNEEPAIPPQKLSSKESLEQLLQLRRTRESISPKKESTNKGSPSEIGRVLDAYCAALHSITLLIECQSEDNEFVNSLVFSTMGDLIAKMTQTLSDQAKLDQETPTAYQLILDIALQACKALESPTDVSLNYAKEVAPHKAEWPVALGARPMDQKKAYEFITGIRLNRERIKHPSKRGPKKTSPVTEYARRLIKYIEAIRASRIAHNYPAGEVYPVSPDLYSKIRTLQKLTPETQNTWFQVAWDALMEFTKNEPQLYEPLSSFGSYREKRAHLLTTTRAPSKERIESENKDGLKEKLKAAFKTIAGE